MKIAIFVDSFYPCLGGMEDATAILARTLGEHGHEVIVFAPRFSPRDFRRRGLATSELDLGERVTVKRLPSLPFWGKIPGRMVIPLGVGYRQLKKEAFDIIHTQSIFGAGLEALWAASWLKIALVGTNHSICSEFAIYSPIAKSFVARVAAGYEAWFYNHCQLVSTASQAVFSALSQEGFNRQHQIVSNIVDLENFQPASCFPLNSFTIAYAGRFAIEKRGEIILRALALIKEKVPQVSLVLAGAGPEEKSWKEMIKSLNLEENVKFVGNLTKPQLAQLFQTIKAFVIASAIENQSMVTLQAMACGLPVVGVNGRGMPELVKDSVNGFIVPIDDYQVMAECLVKLLNDPILARDLGRVGRQKVELFSKQNIAKAWQAVYEQALTKIKNET